MIIILGLWKLWLEINATTFDRESMSLLQVARETMTELTSELPAMQLHSATREE
jgi:hypothetical protein